MTTATFEIAAPPVVVEKPRPAPPPPQENGLWALELLLRNRRELVNRLEKKGDAARATTVLVATCLAGTAIFGGALGLSFGGLQVLFAGLKLPLVVLFSAGVVLPAMLGLRYAFQQQFAPARDAAILIGAHALGALVLAAFAPVVVLAALLQASYPTMIALAVAGCVVAGCVGLLFYGNAIERTGGTNRALIYVVLGVAMSVGGHMTWMMRPFVIRPGAELAFVRSNESGLAESVIENVQARTGFDAPRRAHRSDE